MIVSLQQFCLLLFEPRILPGKYPAMLVSVKISVTVNIQHTDINLKLVKTLGSLIKCLFIPASVLVIHKFAG
jgi:hypothetical protein